MKEDNKYTINNVFLLISIFSLLLTIIIILVTEFPLEQYHSPDNTDSIYNKLSSGNVEKNSILISIAVDTYFIIGFFAIANGLYNYTKETHTFFSKIAEIMGIVAAVSDTFENIAMIILAQGISKGFTPNDLIFLFLWIFVYLKDLSMNMMFIIFAVLLSSSFNSSSHKNIQLTLIVSFIAISFAGSIAMIFPNFTMVRNLLFLAILILTSIFFAKLTDE